LIITRQLIVKKMLINKAQNCQKKSSKLRVL
jgi:hypothetical protein